MAVKRFDVMADHISAALKLAATALEYPILKGIPIERINTHSLRSGGAKALALAGYSDTQIQKMGRWRGATFKEKARWAAFCAPMGMDPFLQDTPFSDRVCMLKGFDGRVRTGYYGHGKQVQAGSVSSTITAVGQTIALAKNTNPTKVLGSDKLCHRPWLYGGKHSSLKVAIR